MRNIWRGAVAVVCGIGILHPMRPFTHLHTHSHYSLLNAVPQIKPLVKKAKEYGMDALALTDCGNLYGAIEFYKECKKQDVKPIIGLDAYVAPRSRHDKEHEHDLRRTKLVLLAEKEEGYHNLVKLVTKSYTEGFFHKPRVDLELLEAHHEGLIAVLPSMRGPHISSLRGNDFERAIEEVHRYRDIF